MTKQQRNRERKRIVIVSDLHLGGGDADPGDDHVYQGGELATFIGALAESVEGRAAELELFINGDFLEFAQAHQDAYASASIDLWCSEPESVAKLEAILAGHKNTFDALGSLMDGGNSVTIAAGNHDVDLYWPGVRTSLRHATRESLMFELGSEWTTRYGDRLQISHGHINDPANTFKRWDDPIRADEQGVARLEMCAGTLFMIKFVNLLEERYPFADNLHPVQQLAKLLLKDEKSGFFAISWALLKFAARHPVAMNQGQDAYGARLLRKLRKDYEFAAALQDAAQKTGSAQYRSVAALRAHVRTEEELAGFILQYWPQLQVSPIAKHLQPQPDLTLAGEAGRRSLGAIKAAGDFGKDALRRVAKNRAGNVEKTQVVVMGHTHIPDEYQVTHKAVYFNPGSWTRYVDLDAHPDLVLEDLRDETRFPYSLRYVQVDLDESDRLISSLKTFKEHQAQFN